MLQPMALKYSAFAVAAVVVAWMAAVLALESDGLIQGSHLMSCDAVAAQDAAWLHYPRIGKASSTSVSKYLVNEKPSDARFVDMLRDFLNPESTALTNAAEWWGGAVNGSRVGEMGLVRLAHDLGKRRSAGRDWKGNAALLGEQAMGYTSGAVVTAIHMYDLDWEKFFLKHGGDIPLGAPTPKLIQVLRNGTDRFISQFYFLKAMGLDGPDEFTGCFGAKGDPGPRCPPPNYQTMYLCGYHPICASAFKGAMSGADGDEALEIAKRNLARFTVVGVSDDLGAFVMQLAMKLPSWFSVSAAAAFSASGNASVRHNVEDKRPDVVSSNTWRRAALENHLDNKLYAFAKARSEQWHSMCRGSDK